MHPSQRRSGDQGANRVLAARQGWRLCQLTSWIGPSERAECRQAARRRPLEVVDDRDTLFNRRSHAPEQFELHEDEHCPSPPRATELSARTDSV